MNAAGLTDNPFLPAARNFQVRARTVEYTRAVNGLWTKPDTVERKLTSRFEAALGVQVRLSGCAAAYNPVQPRQIVPNTLSTAINCSQYQAPTVRVEGRLVGSPCLLTIYMSPRLLTILAVSGRRTLSFQRLSM